MHPQTLTTLLTLTTPLLLRPTSRSTPLTGPLTTVITYHQGLVSSSNGTSSSGLCDAQIVAQGQLTAGYCIGLQTYAISIARMQGLECAFKMFHGSTGCDADANDSVSWFVVVVRAVGGGLAGADADADDGFR
jgi:hypothetical protein